MMVMRMVSLGFDLEPRENTPRKNENAPNTPRKNAPRPRENPAKENGPKEKALPRVSSVPSFGEYLGYCLFPTTSVFGPFLVFSEHMKFLDPSPLIVSVYKMSKYMHFPYGPLCQ